MIQIINKVLTLIQIVIHQKRSPFEFFKSGSSIASSNLAYGLKKYCKDLDLIIDVGANQGQFSIASSKCFPKADIYAFEPSKKTFNKLTKNTKEISNLHLFNCALGNSSGTITFFENDYSHASSILKISKTQVDNQPATRNVTESTVDIKKLDEVDINFGTENRLKVLLKLDVQGYEKNVLEGSLNILEKVDFILFESSFVQMYDNEPLFNELNDFLTNQNFKFIKPLGFFKSKDGDILQMDALYSKV
ncbi:MAG: FkbM family methyltransferase [Salibacteraceae bacterium]|jgi:FkbM family methyltransferase